MQTRKTFWPYGILISIFAIVCACAYTIYYSLDYPVYMDDYYFDKYQKVDSKFNDIQAAQSNFNREFSFDLTPQIELNGEILPNEVEKLRKRKTATIVPLNQDFTLKFDTNATKYSAKILLTRPDSSEFDKELAPQISDGKLIINDLNLTKAGRWQIKAKLAVDENKTGFYQVELYAK
ncbi:hypothetical protein V2I29_05745 [Campylobacter sp. CX2-8023-23]|uniref:hypothetical protein n=1 Tax=Campylobacter porcelli TaxID=1660073 RepID=UPI000A32E356|nr:hypothetical protein [Campylobacter sp. P0078]MEE3705079.1 hypothetical protein [Campylobacter sp. CX2-8023-23]